MKLAWLFLLFALAMSAAPKAVVAVAVHEFGSVAAGMRIEHEFLLRNEGDQPLRISGVSVTPPLQLLRAAAHVPPGGETRLPVLLETDGLSGAFDGELRVRVNDPAMPEVVFKLTGRVAPLIEFKPMAAFFVAGEKGKGAARSVEIINNSTEPLKILEVRHPVERFTTRLESVEEGKRYRLTLTLLPDGPEGRHVEKIVIRTNNPKRTELFVEANTWLRERVFTFPERVDFGALPLSALKASEAGEATGLVQILMVHSGGASGFKATATSSSPMLKVRGEPGPKGDRVQFWVSLDPAAIKAGPISAKLIIETNDAQFARLEVPVGGTILEK